MESQQKEYEQDEWKCALREDFITALTGTQPEKAKAYIKIGTYYHCYAPASLYKYYRDSDQSLDNVRNNKMWYSAPCNFNDVFDCEFSIQKKGVVEDAIKMLSQKHKILQGSAEWKNIYKVVNQQCRVLRTVFDKLRSETGVSCFSESQDSLLMWAHYANNHRGMCVEYNLLEINDLLKFAPVPVIYSGERTCFDSFNPQSVEKDSLKLLIYSITSKSQEWRYEKEWRIIRDSKACGAAWNKETKGALLDMIHPSSITLGCMAQPEFEKKVKDYCVANRITLYKMEKDEFQYRLNKKPLLDFNEED